MERGSGTERSETRQDEMSQGKANRKDRDVKDSKKRRKARDGWDEH